MEFFAKALVAMFLPRVRVSIRAVPSTPRIGGLVSAVNHK